MTEGTQLPIEQPQTPLFDPLETFRQWLALQSATTLPSILEIIGNDLYRRLLPSAAEKVKDAGKDVRSIVHILEAENRLSQEGIEP